MGQRRGTANEELLLNHGLLDTSNSHTTVPGNLLQDVAAASLGLELAGPDERPALAGQLASELDCNVPLHQSGLNMLL